MPASCFAAAGSAAAFSDVLERDAGLLARRGEVEVHPLAGHQPLARTARRSDEGNGARVAAWWNTEPVAKARSWRRSPDRRRHRRRGRCLRPPAPGPGTRCKKTYARTPLATASLPSLRSPSMMVLEEQFDTDWNILRIASTSWSTLRLAVELVEQHTASRLGPAHSVFQVSRGSPRGGCTSIIRRSRALQRLLERRGAFPPRRRTSWQRVCRFVADGAQRFGE